jgi:hypothetical protein
MLYIVRLNLEVDGEIVFNPMRTKNNERFTASTILELINSIGRRTASARAKLSTQDG